MSFALCHAVFGLCDLLWFYHKLNSPIVCFDSVTDFLYCLFSYIRMHFDQSQIQPTPRPPFHRLPSVLVEACLLVGSSWFSHLLVNSVSQMCSQPTQCIHGPSDTGDTAAGEAGHL